MAKILLLAGQKFGKLTFIKETSKTKSGHYKGLFSCDCGKEVERRTSHVYAGETTSCGCYQVKIAGDRFKKCLFGFKHGFSKKDKVRNPVSFTYSSMKERCFNPNCISYKWYGGRGITVCDEWKNSYLEFYNWSMANGYKKGLHIDRINNDGNYEPGNCRYITARENMRNTSRNIWVTYKGERMILKDLSRLSGIYGNTLNSRLKRGLTAEEAVSLGYNKPIKNFVIFE